MTSAEEDLSQYYFEEEEEIICGKPIPSITEEYVEDYPSVVDRFFTRYYYLRPGSCGEDYVVLFHSNRVCLICLAPSHIARSKGITSISFDVGNVDRSLNQVKGKGKKGGMVLQEDSTLAVVTCEDGSTYKIPSCVRGKLIEVNERVVKDPQLLNIEGDGYIAIVLPKPENCDDIKNSLLTQEQYDNRNSNKE